MKRKITKFTIFGLSLHWTKKALVIGSLVFFLLELLGILLELGLDVFFDLGQFSPTDVASMFVKWVLMLLVFLIVDIYAMMRVKQGYSYIFSED